jgi:hypothetical protein
MMRTFEPKKAVSFIKSSPSGERYTFKRGIPVEPSTRFDEIWMDQLVSAGMLKCVSDPAKNPKAKVNPMQRRTTTEDFFPNRVEKEVPREKGYKTKSDREAELKVKKTQEKLRAENPPEEVSFEDEKVQEFFVFLKTLRGKNEREMNEAIYGKYLKDPLVDLCERLKLDSVGKKDELITRLIDHFSMKG